MKIDREKVTKLIRGIALRESLDNHNIIVEVAISDLLEIIEKWENLEVNT